MFPSQNIVLDFCSWGTISIGEIEEELALLCPLWSLRGGTAGRLITHALKAKTESSIFNTAAKQLGPEPKHQKALRVQIRGNSH